MKLMRFRDLVLTAEIACEAYQLSPLASIAIRRQLGRF
jgi:hypothetical protein